MSFVPYTDKIHFEPIKQESVIMSDDDKLVEAGKAIAVGPLCTFIQPGDTFFFLAYGAEVTPDVEGERYWTVAEDSAFIMGKLHV